MLLNWNGWRDTIECLESLFRNDYPRYQVVVCDNGSQDGSLERLQAWAEGHLDVDISPDHPLRHFSFPPVSKPIPFVQLDREQAIASAGVPLPNKSLVLIDNRDNVGFARGTNVGMRYALGQGDCTYIWLLNGDTVVARDALVHLVDRMRRDPGIGLCGSALLFYHEPCRVQALCGATFNRWFATSRHIGAFRPAERCVNVERTERDIDYVVGASLLTSRRFVEAIGLMSEDYFLYFEEIDWATRASGKYKLACSLKSIVYHKEGASIGSSSKPAKKSLAADYYGLRNRLVFTRKFFPLRLPTVYLGLLIAMLRRVARGQWDRVGMVWKIIWTG